jgi:type IV secretory pathway TrbD component
VEIPDVFCAAFHESSNRAHLLLGCEPTALGIAFVVSIVIGFSVPTWWGIAVAIFVFFFLRQVLREMAKEDPHLISVHHNAQRYNQGFWTAKPVEVKRWRTK